MIPKRIVVVLILSVVCSVFSIGAVAYLLARATSAPRAQAPARDAKGACIEYMPSTKIVVPAPCVTDVKKCLPQIAIDSKICTYAAGVALIQDPGTVTAPAPAAN